MWILNNPMIKLKFGLKVSIYNSSGNDSEVSYAMPHHPSRSTNTSPQLRFLILQGWRTRRAQRRSFCRFFGTGWESRASSDLHSSQFYSLWPFTWAVACLMFVWICSFPDWPWYAASRSCLKARWHVRWLGAAYARFSTTMSFSFFPFLLCTGTGDLCFLLHRHLWCCLSSGTYWPASSCSTRSTFCGMCCITRCLGSTASTGSITSTRPPSHWWQNTQASGRCWASASSQQWTLLSWDAIQSPRCSSTSLTYICLWRLTRAMTFPGPHTDWCPSASTEELSITATTTSSSTWTTHRTSRTGTYFLAHCIEKTQRRSQEAL